MLNNKKSGKHFSNNKTPLLIIFLRVISLIMILVSLYYIFNWFYENNKTDNIMKNILKEIEISDEQVQIENTDIQVTVSNVSFDSLLSINSDTIGWLKVSGTQINYPIVQTDNNSFYLTHSFDKSYNKAGWCFADYRNKNLKNSELGKNTIIYGHNRMNSSMFGTLKNVLEKNWQTNKQNKYINFSTLGESLVWEVFSVYTISNEDYYLKTDFSSDAEYQTFLSTLKKRSIYDFGTEISYNDKILTLSTCTNIDNKRTVVHAKLLYLENP